MQENVDLAITLLDAELTLFQQRDQLSAEVCMLLPVPVCPLTCTCVQYSEVHKQLRDVGVFSGYRFNNSRAGNDEKPYRGRRDEHQEHVAEASAPATASGSSRGGRGGRGGGRGGRGAPKGLTHEEALQAAAEPSAQAGKRRQVCCTV